MVVKSRGRSAALVRINANTLIKGFAISVWVFGCVATAWLGYRLFPNVQPGQIMLGAVIVQFVLTLGQLHVVRRYFGGLPTFFFAVDTMTNFLAGLDIIYDIDYNGGSAFVKSLVTALSTGEWAINFGLVVVLLFVAFKVATTPESVIDIGGEE